MTRTKLALIALAIVPAAAQAQQALGVPFVGKNHLSFSVTDLSRDGIGTERAGVFGGMYGRRINDGAGTQYTVLVRAAARSFDGTDEGIVDAGFTVAATRYIDAVSGLSLTGAAGLGATAWGRAAHNPGELDRGRRIVKAPVSAAVAYDLKAGNATIAPFVALTSAYSNERNYLDEERISNESGWRLGHTAGVSVRFRETVLSLSGIHRERGMPNRDRMAFSVGMSW